MNVLKRNGCPLAHPAGRYRAEPIRHSELEGTDRLALRLRLSAGPYQIRSAVSLPVRAPAAWPVFQLRRRHGPFISGCKPKQKFQVSPDNLSAGKFPVFLEASQCTFPVRGYLVPWLSQVETAG